MQVQGTTGGFQQPYANRALTLQLTVDDLALRIVTVGRASLGDVFAGGAQRAAEIDGLLSLTYAYVEATNASLRTTKLFRSLESSEKAAFTFRIGMGVAKAVAEAQLGTPWLRHLEPLIKHKRAQIVQGTKERPDLAGLDGGHDWHIVEAKGRIRRPTNKTRADAKRQASRVLSIDGVAPSTRCYSIAHIAGPAFTFEFNDPPAAPDLPRDRRHVARETTRISLKKDAFLEEYYSPLPAFKEAGLELREVAIRGAEERPSYVALALSRHRAIALRKDLYEAALSRRMTSALVRDLVSSEGPAAPSQSPNVLAWSGDGYALLKL